MSTALLLLIAQGALGAFDTLWFHELKARLPGRADARVELALHAARDFLYAILFAALAWSTWLGAWAALLAALLAIEIVITMADFVIEDRTRPLAPLERVTHAVMGIIYGAFLGHAVPEIHRWWSQPTGFGAVDHGWVSVVLTVMATGVALSGVRDALAVLVRGPEAPLRASDPGAAEN